MKGMIVSIVIILVAILGLIVACQLQPVKLEPTSVTPQPDQNSSAQITQPNETVATAPIPNTSIIVQNKTNVPKADVFNLTNKDCESNQTRDKCYLDLALWNRDSKYCSKISDLDNKRLCYIYRTNTELYDSSLIDIEDCPLLETDEASLDFCYSSVAIHNLDRQLCIKVLDPRINTQCIAIAEERAAQQRTSNW